MEAGGQTRGAGILCRLVPIVSARQKLINPPFPIFFLFFFQSVGQTEGLVHARWAIHLVLMGVLNQGVTYQNYTDEGDLVGGED